MSQVINLFNAFIKKILRNFVFSFVLYKFALDVLYYGFISDRYAYILGYKDPVCWKYVLGWVCFAFFVFLRKRIKNKDLDFSFCFLFLLSIVPTITVFWVRNYDTIAFLYIIVFWIVFAFSCDFISRTAYGFDIEYNRKGLLIKSDNHVIHLCFIFLLISTVYFSYIYGEFRVFVNFSDVYNYRLDVSNYMGVVEAYIFSWNTNLLLPMLIFVHLCNNKFTLVILEMLSGLMLYSIYGNKVILFQLIYVSGLWIIKKSDLDGFVNIFVIFTITIASACSVLFDETLIGYWGSGLLYRLLYIPAEAHWFYFDFFQYNPLLYLRQGMLSWLFEDPYKQPMSVIIGSCSDYYYTVQYNNLNNGLFSDAYANFGVVGVLVYPIIISVSILIYSRSMRLFDPTFRKAIMITFFFNIISASIFQSWLTGGMIVGVLIMFCIRRTIRDDVNKWSENR